MEQTDSSQRRGGEQQIEGEGTSQRICMNDPRTWDQINEYKIKNRKSVIHPSKSWYQTYILCLPGRSALSRVLRRGHSNGQATVLALLSLHTYTPLLAQRTYN